jgi:hypothetical protein
LQLVEQEPNPPLHPVRQRPAPSQVYAAQLPLGSVSASAGTQVPGVAPLHSPQAHASVQQTPSAQLPLAH